MVTTSSSVFDAVRTRFPALREAGDREIFFDNAAGAQVPDEVVEAMRDHLVVRNVQRGGRYARSREVDARIAETRALLASFLNAASPDEIVFGLNATSLTRSVAESLRPKLRPGDRVIVTELDHEANVGPWLRLESSGVTPVFWRIRGPGATLDLADLREILRAPGGPVRVLAMPLASNTTGGIVDVAAAARLAREAGALVFVDAVHFAPHGATDVRALGADFLAFSGYKIFGPHVGFLWGRPEGFRALEPAREFFIPETAPYSFESGTQSYEGIAGMAGAMRYLASLAGAASAMAQVREVEIGLTETVLRSFREIPGLTVLGEASPERAALRVPTFSFRIDGVPPARIVERLSEAGIHARDGHMYAPRLLQALGIDLATGVCRVSLCHYNTPREIDRMVTALRAMRPHGTKS
jgi:cysteine desulfurase family protein (TIGR01976 family)